MTIEVTTKAELLEELQSYLASRLPDVVTAADSDIGVLLSMMAEAQFGAHAKIVTVFDDLFVSDRTSTVGLDQHAAARLAGGRKGATIATGIGAVQVSGTVGATVSSGDQLVYSDGTRYKLTEAETIGAGGTVGVDAESIGAGTDANRSIGDLLTFVETPSGISSQAELVNEIDGAENAESDGALVARLLDAYKNPPASGRFSDWRQWATAVTGIAAAYAYGPSSAALLGRRGLGIVDVVIAAAGSGAARVPTSTVQDDVEDAIDDARPACTRDWAVVLPTTVAQAVDVTITPEAGYEFDWTSGTSFTVANWHAGTKQLTWSATIPATVLAGDRIIVLGQLATIVMVLSATVTTIDIDLSPAPSGGEAINPAGPLTQPAIDAVTDLFDALGPARGTAADPEHAWEDTLRLAGITDVLMDTTGIRDVSITTPGANVTPSDTGSTIELLIPGVISIQPA